MRKKKKKTIPTHMQHERKSMIFSSSRQKASLLRREKCYGIECLVKEHDEITRTRVKTRPEFLPNAASFGSPMLITSKRGLKLIPLSKSKWIHSYCLPLLVLRGWRTSWKLSLVTIPHPHSQHRWEKKSGPMQFQSALFVKHLTWRL